MLGLLAVFGCASAPNAPLEPPRADAGGDLQARVRETVVLNGSGSAAEDGGELRYAWAQVSGPAAASIDGDESPLATVVPDRPGTYVFRLTVTDGEGTSATDEVYLLVLEDAEGDGSPGGEDGAGSGDAPDPPANVAPQADAGPDRQVEAGSPASLDGSRSSDAEGDALRYAWVQVSGPGAVGIAGGDSPQATVVPLEAGEYVFRLTVTDAAGLSHTDETSLLVTPGSQGGNVSIAAAPVGRGVARVEYLITAADMDTLRGELILTGDRVARRIVLNVGAGDNRLLELHAYDSRNQQVAFGAILIQVVEDQTAEVEVVLHPLLPGVGEIEVEAVFEGFGG